MFKTAYEMNQTAHAFRTQRERARLEREIDNAAKFGKFRVLVSDVKEFREELIQSGYDIRSTRIDGQQFYTIHWNDEAVGCWKSNTGLKKKVG